MCLTLNVDQPDFKYLRAAHHELSWYWPVQARRTRPKIESNSGFKFENRQDKQAFNSALCDTSTQETLAAITIRKLMSDSSSRKKCDPGLLFLKFSLSNPFHKNSPRQSLWGLWRVGEAAISLGSG